MKALSGYAEWFWLIGKRWKDVENRPWPLSRYIKSDELPYRFYLHASKTPASQEEIDFIVSKLSSEQCLEFMDTDFDALRGKLIGEATAIAPVGKGFFRMTPPSVWFFGPEAFLVSDGILYPTPIPYRGQLGFFEVTP